MTIFVVNKINLLLSFTGVKFIASLGKRKITQISFVFGKFPMKKYYEELKIYLEGKCSPILLLKKHKKVFLSRREENINYSLMPSRPKLLNYNRLLKFVITPIITTSYLVLKKKKKYRTFWGTLHISAKINHWLLSLQKTRYIQIYSLKSLLSRKILKHVVNLSRQLNCIYLFFIHWKRHLRIRELFTYIAK